MKKIYIAGPLFNAAEISFNLILDNYLVKSGYNTFLPQRECQGKTGQEIFNTCLNGLNSSDIVLAILDGSDADSGTSWECGYAYGKQKPIVSLRTDFRKSGDTGGFNAMLYYSSTFTIEEESNFLDKITNAIEKLI